MATLPTISQYLRWSEVPITWDRTDHPDLIPTENQYAMVQSFHKVIDGIISGVVGQIGSYSEPPGQVIAGVFAFSLNSTRQIEDGHHSDELGSLLSRHTGEAGGLAAIFHLYILHMGGLGGP